jgi:excisionase family DNA binding protein
MRSEKLFHGAQNMTTVTTDLLTRADVAKLFGVSVLSVIRMQAAGKLPAVRLGAATIRYKRSDVLAYIESCISK